MMMLRCAAAAASLRNATTAAQAPRRVVAPLRNAGLCGCGCGDTVVSHRALRTSSVSNSAAAEGLFDPHELARAREAEESRRKASTPSDAPSAVLQAAASAELSHFKEGFLRFKREVIAVQPERFRGLAAAQHPKTMVIGCCDSRVDPALLLGASPGDLFVVRNVANLVPPYERRGSYHGTSAALEFAVTGLKVENIIVLGHQHCGGIAALMRRGGEKEVRNDFIDKWMELAESACEHTRISVGHLPFEAQCAHCERESINVSLANLLTFPWVKEAVAAGTLRLHGWYYDMEQASLETWSLRYQISGFERIN